LRRAGRQEVAALSDEALLRLVGARHADAFNELYRRHAPAVVAVASRLLSDRADADEATQRAFMMLWNRASSIDARGGSLRPWLVTVGRNAAVDHVRRVRASTSTDALHERIPATGAGPEETAMQRDVRRDIDHALESLDPEQRAVLELAYFGGLSQTEISAQTGVPLGTVKSRVRLAMRHLRRILEPGAGELA
jgi:RNA polymerase sigma-70 factor (ECF subfamily)